MRVEGSALVAVRRNLRTECGYSVRSTATLRAGAQSSRAPHGVSALRAEVSPDGDEGAALDSQGGRVPLDSRFGIAVSGTRTAKL